MKDEVCFVIKFFIEVFLRNFKVSDEKIQIFKDILEQLIIVRFENYWYLNKLLKGNVFRCINIEMIGIDFVLLKVIKVSGILFLVLLEIFLGGFVLWIDFGEVFCRIGKGFICLFYCNNF